MGSSLFLLIINSSSNFVRVLKMAYRPKGYGMTAELANKRARKFDAELASEAMGWVKDVLEASGNDEAVNVAGEIGSIKGAADVKGPLKNGVILCHLINSIQPGSVKRINESSLVFKEMENISNFLTGCEGIGCSTLDLFQTVDLYEGNNIPQVINGLFALGRKAQKTGYDGPKLGPEEASENRREFTEEQLRAGEGVLAMQAGYNKGASQAGQNFGKTRAIID